MFERDGPPFGRTLGAAAARTATRAAGALADWAGAVLAGAGACGARARTAGMKRDSEGLALPLAEAPALKLWRPLSTSPATALHRGIRLPPVEGWLSRALSNSMSASESRALRLVMELASTASGWSSFHSSITASCLGLLLAEFRADPEENGGRLRLGTRTSISSRSYSSMPANNGAKMSCRSASSSGSSRGGSTVRIISESRAELARDLRIAVWSSATSLPTAVDCAPSSMFPPRD
mmetsp:Transcript_35338/g.77404  ORF Transcript_35338/g.77404 Transcript_35338/m.77404 type:complete len:237 (-) Transcript_35338:124-834(-)